MEGRHDCRRARRDGPSWHTKTTTARRVKGRISSIMRWAIAQNYIENNLASHAVAAALPRDTTRDSMIRPYHTRRS